jgi:signal transduction histidine kinase/ActR/RegA family two-component response regulator
MLSFFKPKRKTKSVHRNFKRKRVKHPETSATDVHWKNREDLKDLVLIGVIGILAFVLTHALELNKVLNKVAVEHGEWPILEFITVPTIMSFAFGLYALRRWKDARRAAKKAYKASIDKSQFLANISHEIRTPMNAVIGFAQILSSEKLTIQQQDYVNIIEKSGKNMLKLIDDILDLSKVEAGKVDVEMSVFSLKELLAGISALMKPSAKVKRLDFEIYEDENLPWRIRTDPIRLRQCLTNIISNAIKFTNTGHVYVKVSSQRINDKTFFRFDIEDTGIGIPEDKQEAIFTSYVQVDGSQPHPFGSAGLGLSITKHLVELLGGELSLKSEVGTGSVYSLIIPAGIEATEELIEKPKNIAAQLETEQNRQEQVEFTGRVLVVEDIRTNQMLIKVMLEKMGFTVTVAEDGKKAVEKAMVEPFDLIFMDMQMPSMNGYEATGVLRRKEIETPIIALTAYAMKGDREKCISAGCDDYLSKPIDRDELLEIIWKYIQTASETVNETINAF